MIQRTDCQSRKGGKRPEQFVMRTILTSQRRRQLVWRLANCAWTTWSRMRTRWSSPTPAATCSLGSQPDNLSKRAVKAEQTISGTIMFTRQVQCACEGLNALRVRVSTYRTRRCRQWSTEAPLSGAKQYTSGSAGVRRRTHLWVSGHIMIIYKF